MPFTDHDLQTACALLTAVSSNTNDLIFVKNCAGELLFANPAARRQLGLGAEEALHRSSNALFADGEEAQRIDREDRRAMQERAPLTLEETLHFCGEVRTYSTTRSPWFDHDGHLIGVVGVSTDITARKQAEDLMRAREQRLEATVAERTAALRDLANHIETVREEEKRVIARELHDEMGAMLTSLSMHLQGAYVLFPDEEKWRLRKAKIQSLLSEVVATTRRMQTSLRPTMLELFGLKTAVSELITGFSEQSGLQCHVSLPDEDLPTNSRLDIALYRMLQEILNNVAKHAHASRVDVILDIDEDRLALTVRDDGVGIPAERLGAMQSHGLRGLHERAVFFGGHILVRNGADGGTTVVIRVPVTAWRP